MARSRVGPAPGTRLTVSVVSRVPPPGATGPCIEQQEDRPCVMLLTLARALGRADAVRDQAERSAANDNDARRDLRPLQ